MRAITPVQILWASHQGDVTHTGDSSPDSWPPEGDGSRKGLGADHLRTMASIRLTRMTKTHPMLTQDHGKGGALTTQPRVIVMCWRKCGENQRSCPYSSPEWYSRTGWHGWTWWLVSHCLSDELAPLPKLILVVTTLYLPVRSWRPRIQLPRIPFTRWQETSACPRCFPLPLAVSTKASCSI